MSPPIPVARGKNGAVLTSSFSTDRSSKTRAIKRDWSPPDLLAPRRWTPPSDEAST